MRRSNLEGAENYIYDLEKNPVKKVRLEEPMDSIYFDDAAIFHGVSPFAPIDVQQRATRDMLILLYQPLAESPQRAGKRRILCEYSLAS